MQEQNLIMYHNQASKDKFAEIPDMSYRIAEATIKAIGEAYREYLQELMLEAQEAY